MTTWNLCGRVLTITGPGGPVTVGSDGSVSVSALGVALGTVDVEGVDVPVVRGWDCARVTFRGVDEDDLGEDDTVLVEAHHLDAVRTHLARLGRTDIVVVAPVRPGRQRNAPVSHLVI